MARVLGDTLVQELQTVCRSGCLRMVAYVPNDVLRRDGTDYSGPDGEEYIICPGCSKKIVLRAW